MLRAGWLGQKWRGKDRKREQATPKPTARRQYPRLHDLISFRSRACT